MALGVIVVLGVAPGAQGGRLAKVGASASLAAQGQEGPDGVIRNTLVLEHHKTTKTCVRKKGRRICISDTSMHVSFADHEDEEGESPDQGKCSVGPRRITLFEKTSSGNKKVTSAMIGPLLSGAWTGASNTSKGDKFQAVADPFTFSDRYGDLITCAKASSNILKL